MTNPSENFVHVVGDGLVRRLGLLDLVLIGGDGDRWKLEEEKWIRCVVRAVLWKPKEESESCVVRK